MTAGLAIRLDANASPTPQDDICDCESHHQDTDGIGVCCVFYGGTYDERSGECWDYPEATVEQVNPGPKTPPKRPVLTRLPNLQAISVA